jgi:hypothetical protein
MKSNAWYGIDLDGTLAYHDEDSTVDTVGEPIEPIVNLVHDLIKQGYEVRIFTARVWVPSDETWTKELANECGRQRAMIGDWCEKHLGFRLKITCEKDYKMAGLVDDRAYRVIRNTGQIIV